MLTPVAIGVDAIVGYTRVYGSHIAWSSPTTPLAREINPRSVYERLFRASSGPQGDSAKMDTLLLDRVLGDAKRLRAAGRRCRPDSPGRVSVPDALARRARGARSQHSTKGMETAGYRSIQTPRQPMLR